MRGKGFDADCVGVRPGITPAYAGKSPNRNYRWCEIGDHPRLCGEKLCHGVCGRVKLGSPPPMRGKD